LVKKKLSWLEKAAKLLKVKVQEYHYDNEGIYASRKVIKNQYNVKGDYYNDTTDWRKTIHEQIFPYLSEGMTVYYEIVGYTPSGTMIQKYFDYGCEQGELAFYIYRITYTNTTGKVFEFSSKQVQEWCKMNGLKAVPELYFGTPYDFIGESTWHTFVLDEDSWRDFFLERLKVYWESQCTMCKFKVPSEGIVLRKEGLELKTYKYKNFDFLQFESKQLDNNEVNIEDDNT
jgi:hypothetical protein